MVEQQLPTGFHGVEGADQRLMEVEAEETVVCISARLGNYNPLNDMQANRPNTCSAGSHGLYTNLLLRKTLLLFGKAVCYTNSPEKSPH